MHLAREGPRRVRRLVLAMAAIAFVAAVGAVPADAHLRWQWPLDPQPVVVRPFEPPAESWSAGHRGVDLRGEPFQPVLAVATGQVTFAGVVAGRGVVVVGHGSLRSTYQPVTAAVHVGQEVSAGEVVAMLQTAGSHCAPQACLHLGVRRGDMYVDPLVFLGPQHVILKPLGGGPRAPDLDGVLRSSKPTGFWSSAGVRHPALAPTRSRSSGAPPFVAVGAAAAVARVATALLTALGDS